MKMKKWGATLLFLGIGSFILPLLGMQFRLLNLFGEGSQPAVGILMAIVGGGLLFVSRMKEKGTSSSPSMQSGTPVVNRTAPSSPQGSQAATFTPHVPPRPVPPPPAGDRPRFCGQCGAALKGGGAFCGSCGSPVGTTATVASLQLINLPNDAWAWKTLENEGGTEREMYLKKYGEAVTVRLAIYSTPNSAEEHLGLVGDRIMKKPENKVHQIERKQVGGQDWYAVSVERSGGIRQELWTRKPDPAAVFDVMYTALGDFFNRYYSDFMVVVESSSRT